MMAFSGRRKLFEVLNRAREESDEVGSIASTSSTEPTAEAETLTRGAGRARLFAGQSVQAGGSGTTSSQGAGRARLFLHQTNSQNDNCSHRNDSVAVEERSTPGYTQSNTGCTSIKSYCSNTLTALELKENKIGFIGNPVPLAVNYIPIKCGPDAAIFDYDVSFEPNIHSNMIRRGILASVIRPIAPVYTFDGTTIYLRYRLSENPLKLFAKNRNNNDSPVELTIKFRSKQTMKECIHFYNILFKQVMLKLEYVQFGQKMFDPTEPKTIPHRQLTIWPGYVLACDEYDEGLMLMVDTSHRVLIDTKVSDLLRRIRMSCQQNPSQSFKDLVRRSLFGAVVLTSYNNKTYRIDDVDFDKTPMSTFHTKDGEITYVQYYKQHYQKDIHDLYQPLLISYKEHKIIGPGGQIQEDRLTMCLIPELSQLTGLTDEMRNDHAVMRDIASITRVTPNQRVDAARKYIAKVNETPSACELLEKWGLRLSDDILRLQGRQLPGETIRFGRDQCMTDVSGDFGHQIGNNILFEVVDLNHWILMYTRQNIRAKEEFIKHLGRCASAMGLTWKNPVEIMLPDDRTTTYNFAIRQNRARNTQIIVFICPTSRDDRYATIKKITCSEIPTASQVINARTLANQQKNRSIVQKILMQMNCKLGGSLWAVNIPFKNVMICGMDTYHNPNRKEKSVAAFVASLNRTYTKWYSKATIQGGGEELSHGLAVSVEGALKAYRDNNGILPDRIIMFRDGVGNGQFALCKGFEFPQIKTACHLVDANYIPKITFIVVQKRINTRIFAIEKGREQFDNAPPGTIVDHSITRRGLFDYFLVSQKMRHGTVTPSHYVVIENEANLSPDVVQQLSYKLTYQYFNWPGSIRVPAPCQYAHKLAYLVGESIKRETSEQLNDKLFYL